MREEMPTKKPMNVKILAIGVGVYIIAAITSFLVFNS
jgi:hypothetical protein